MARDVLRATARARAATRSAIRSCAGPSTRRRARRGGCGAHARAAAALAARPSALAARAHHVERSARVGDEAAAAILEQAAQQAAARAPAVAAGWLSAALRLLPDRGSAERRLGLLVPLATALAATGRLEEALERLLETLEQIPPELAALRVRLVAACASCENALGRHDAAHARLLHALAEFPDDGSAGGAALQVELAADALYDNDFAAMRRWGGRAAETAEALADPGLLAVAQALRVLRRLRPRRRRRGPSRPASRAPPRSTRSPTSCWPRASTCPYYLGFAEYFCERYEDAARHLRRGIALARAVGQGQFVVPMMVGLAQALERLGRLREALSTAEAAVEASRLSGNPQAVGFALVAEAWTAAELGDVAHARAAAEEAVALLDALDESVFTRRDARPRRRDLARDRRARPLHRAAAGGGRARARR